MEKNVKVGIWTKKNLDGTIISQDWIQGEKHGGFVVSKATGETIQGLFEHGLQSGVRMEIDSTGYNTITEIQPFKIEEPEIIQRSSSLDNKSSRKFVNKLRS